MQANQGGALWGGRFRDPMAPAMARLNRSLSVDHRLWKEDIRASQAWAQALGKAGVLTPEEVETLLRGLEGVARRLAVGGGEDESDEDIHSLVERWLYEEVGALAGKLHTGRSRNDQVATDFRMWGMQAGARIREELDGLLEALLLLGEDGVDRILPGYTHLQQAQPIRAAHWALSHVWALLRDRDRIRLAEEQAAVLPLGSGAVAGCAFAVDRHWLANALGFREVSANSMDAVGDRDWAVEMAFAGALLGVHLSRLGEDLVLFSTREFSFLRLSDSYSTGSSLLPHKRNPDVAELVRGKAGRLMGNLVGLLTMLKGLPSGYNRDLQEDKALLFDTVDTLLLVLPALAGALATAQFLPEGEKAFLAPELLATDVADYLVRKGVPFREAHEVVGRAVRLAEDEGLTLATLGWERLQSLHPAFGPDVEAIFSWEASVEARGVPGGTARRAVLSQLTAARRAIRR